MKFRSWVVFSLIVSTVASADDAAPDLTEQSCTDPALIETLAQSENCLLDVNSANCIFYRLLIGSVGGYAVGAYRGAKKQEAAHKINDRLGQIESKLGYPGMTEDPVIKARFLLPDTPKYQTMLEQYVNALKVGPNSGPFSEDMARLRVEARAEIDRITDAVFVEAQMLDDMEKLGFNHETRQQLRNLYADAIEARVGLLMGIGQEYAELEAKRVAAKSGTEEREIYQLQKGLFHGPEGYGYFNFQKFPKLQALYDNFVAKGRAFQQFLSSKYVGYVDVDKEAFKGAALGTILVAGMTFYDPVKNLAAAELCGYEMSGVMDRLSFTQYLAVDGDCNITVPANKIFELKKMSYSERTEIIKTTPHLCKTLSRQYVEYQTRFSSMIPTISRPPVCHSDTVTYSLTIGNEVYPQRLRISDRDIILEGSFLQGESDQQLKSKRTSFSIYLKNDFSWSTILTDAPAWAILNSLPLERSSVSPFTSFYWNNNSCRVLSAAEQANFRAVSTDPSLSQDLKCAAGKQIIAASMVLPRILESCVSGSN